MSESSSEEKTEPPSAKKLKKAREEGQVARSPDVTKLLVYVALGTFLLFQFKTFFESLASLCTAIYFDRTLALISKESTLGFGYEAFFMMAKLGLQILAVGLVASVAGDILQVKPLLAWKAVQFDFSRILPSKGFKKIFSMESVSNLGLMLVKALLIGFALFMVVLSYAPSLIGMPMGGIENGLVISLKLISSLFLWSVLIVTVTSVVDYVLKHRAWKKRLFMSKSEVKRENIESYGNPIIKKAIKQLQSEDDNMGKMFKNIRFCNVMVLDGEGRVIGLYFNALFNPEPVALVLASGTTAERVMESAASSNIRVIHDAEFVSTLFGMLHLGSPIPPEHKEAAMHLIAGR